MTNQLDLKRYEGYSKRDRIWYEYSRGLTSDFVYDSIDADENLVRDAPLLLEEVLRLREELERMTTLCTWWVAEAERLEKEMEMIE
tara:strand:+ start:196 stop:453 length:258 start_codon:yes stop_codon:yes gene_type:complete